MSVAVTTVITGVRILDRTYVRCIISCPGFWLIIN